MHSIIEQIDVLEPRVSHLEELTNELEEYSKELKVKVSAIKK